MWLLLTVACTGGLGDPGCLHRDLDDWCRHEESEDGPVGEGACGEPEPDPTFRCGDYDVEQWGGGFTSETRYFDAESGQLVAVAYGTDVNTYCGGFTYWYGRRVECEPECSYADDPDLPPCE
jgi:hypothetical protein